MPAMPRLEAPRTVFRTVTPLRPANAVVRSREYLTLSEVEKLISAARSGRYGHRDATLILVAYRHGLRASEVADLRVESGRVRPQCDAARAPGQERQAERPSAPGRRGSSAARAAAAISGLDLRVRHRARRRVHPRRRQPPGQAHRRARRHADRARSHAAPRLRLRPGQCRPRYETHSGLARPSIHPAHDALHAIERGTVQGLLEVIDLGAFARRRGDRAGPPTPPLSSAGSDFSDERTKSLSQKCPRRFQGRIPRLLLEVI